MVCLHLFWGEDTCCVGNSLKEKEKCECFETIFIVSTRFLYELRSSCLRPVAVLWWFCIRLAMVLRSSCEGLVICLFPCMPIPLVCLFPLCGVSGRVLVCLYPCHETEEVPLSCVSRHILMHLRHFPGHETDVSMVTSVSWQRVQAMKRCRQRDTGNLEMSAGRNADNSI